MEPAPSHPRHAEFLAILRARLPEKKVNHCVSVTEFLSTFAHGLGLDAEEFFAAGMLHDICRGLDDDQLLRRAERYGLQPNATQLRKPNLLHGPLAAEECRREWGLDSEALYDALYWHTTGRPGLGRLGQALYFADFSEPLRDFPEAEIARDRLSQQGFDAALRYVAGEKRAFLAQKAVIDPITEDFYRWLCGETHS